MCEAFVKRYLLWSKRVTQVKRSLLRV